MTDSIQAQHDVDSAVVRMIDKMSQKEKVANGLFVLGPSTRSNPTAIVREVMREMGAQSIYTNKLKNGRTVKCYVDVGVDAVWLDYRIRNALSWAGVVDFQIRYREAPDYGIAHRGPIADSLIVEIPYTVQP
jgi:hypothetical protein